MNDDVLSVILNELTELMTAVDTPVLQPEQFAAAFREWLKRDACWPSIERLTSRQAVFVLIENYAWVVKGRQRLAEFDRNAYPSFYLELEAELADCLAYHHRLIEHLRTMLPPADPLRGVGNPGRGSPNGG